LATDYQQQYNFCQSQKALGDTQFFQWLKNKDFEFVVIWLNTSAENAACSEKNRVYAHVYQIMYKLLDDRQNLLQNKYNLLINNQTLILQNLDLFKDNYLSRLVELRNELVKYDYYIK
jgi:hypothetical protein